MDRTPLTPAPSPRETHADHGDHGDHDDDDGDDHMHGDGDVHVDETPVASVSASVSGTPSVSPSVPPSVSPSVSPSVTASQTPSATATATPSESPYAKCKKIKKRNVSGTSVIHFSTGQDSGKFKITYKPNDGLSRVDVLYTGDATYDTVPEVGGNGVVKVKYRGSSEIGIIVERRVGVRGSVRVVIHCPV